MFKIEITDDRSPARRRADPVVEEAGVFAVLAPEDLSKGEQLRPVLSAEAAQKRAKRPHRLWLAQDVAKYLTHLYSRFKNPFRKS